MFLNLGISFFPAFNPILTRVEASASSPVPSKAAVPAAAAIPTPNNFPESLKSSVRSLAVSSAKPPIDSSTPPLIVSTSPASSKLIVFLNSFPIDSNPGSSSVSVIAFTPSFFPLSTSCLFFISFNLSALVILTASLEILS